jgi:plasmid stabilization system protein ParE
MSRKVDISKTAQKKLDNLFNYLIENWSTKVKNEFVQKLDNSIKTIKNQPEAFPESTLRNGLRKCVITKQTTMFYRFNSSRVFIVTIFDSRQNPEKLNEEL